jgi:hypothetical protein
MLLTEKPEVAGQNVPYATPPIADLKWTGLGLNPSLRGYRLVTNRINRSTTF